MLFEEVTERLVSDLLKAFLARFNPDNPASPRLSRHLSAGAIVLVSANKFLAHSRKFRGRAACNRQTKDGVAPCHVTRRPGLAGW